MNINIKKLLLLVAVSAYGVSAQAAENGPGYVGAGAALWTLSQDGAPDAEGTGFRLIAGYRPWTNIGIELQIAGGGSDDVRVQGFVPADDPADPPIPVSIDAQVKLNQLWSLAVRPQLPLGGRFNLYGLLGYTYAKADFRSESSWSSDSDTGISYGAGGEYAILPGRFHVGVDFVQYLNKSDYSAEAISVGARYQF